MVKLVVAFALMVATTASSSANAQFGGPWGHIPTLTVISEANDSRLALVDEAVDFWNKTLGEIGSGFRLGAVTRSVQTLPEEALQSLSSAVLGRRNALFVPQSLRDVPGDITIFLGQSEFVSFVAPADNYSKRVVGIRGQGFPPLNLPNVARNVIAHELGHAIGLGHNSDPTTLMCGRPAECRPALFRSNQPRFFPLTEAEKRQLLWLYPPEWEAEAK